MSPLATYLTRLQTLRANPNATDELSLRPALDELFQSLAPKNIRFVGEGKKLAAGRPDFSFSRSPLGDTFGYVEAEKPAADLDNLAGHAKHQNDAFKADFDNFLLTNHYDFRLYDSGKKEAVERVVLPPSAAELAPEHEDGFARLWERFVEADVPAPATARELAILLARRAKALRFNIGAALGDAASPLHRDLEAFRKLLLPDLTTGDFANLYAETLAYGLFAARCQHTGAARFSLANADRALRRTPLLRTLYRLFEEKIDPNLEWILDAMAAILDGAAIDDIRDYFQNRAGRPDPMIDFYEPFLAQYDARARQARGVYYTPEPVVGFIVRGVHALLRERFGLSDGVAGGAKILDPATGTGSFLFAVLDEMHRAIGPGDWKAFVRDRKPLDDLFGFEILVAPYTVAHLKLALQLEGMGTPLGADQRLNIFLTNTLDDARYQRDALLESSIADEVNAAADVKEKTKILVVLGNPPYAGHSSNANTRIEGDTRVFTGVGKQIESYKSIDGVALQERNLAWLYNDYVKFLAFAQQRIEKSGKGIVAFITDNGYLDNPTFRGMRKSLLDTFSSIYVLDLHGNSKKREVAPDNGVDQNVFDIQQGVSIVFAVKEKGEIGGKIHHAELWGRRAEKYNSLNSNELETIEWFDWEPVAPTYLFKPSSAKFVAEYQAGWKVTDIFPVNGWGTKTRKDYLLVDFSKDVLTDRFEDIKKLTAAAATAKYNIKSAPHWDFAQAKQLLSSDFAGEHVKKFLFRPFDFRYIYFEKCMIERGDHKYDLMSNFFKENISLITVRRVEAGEVNHFFCSKEPSVLHSTSPKESNFVFPLYLYSNGIFGEEKRANLSADFLQELAARGIESPAPEDVFGYIYAVLHAPTYRARYGAFLKTDFPRVPLPTSLAAFEKMAAHGRHLVALHTLDSKAAPELNDKRHALSSGSDLVAKPRYDGATRRLYLNDEQWFADVDAQTATFPIGGYTVADKWLSDRRGRTLSFDERRLFPQILVALAETRRVMNDIDALFLADFA